MSEPVEEVVGDVSDGEGVCGDLLEGGVTGGALGQQLRDASARIGAGQQWADWPVEHTREEDGAVIHITLPPARPIAGPRA